MVFGPAWAKKLGQRRDAKQEFGFSAYVRGTASLCGVAWPWSIEVGYAADRLAVDLQGFGDGSGELTAKVKMVNN